MEKELISKSEQGYVLNENLNSDDNYLRQATRLRHNTSDFESNSDLEDVLFIQSKPKIISQNVSKVK